MPTTGFMFTRHAEKAVTGTGGAAELALAGWILMLDELYRTAKTAPMTSPSVAQTAVGEIETANQRFVQALNKGDAAMIAGVYTERDPVLPPTADMAHG